MTARDWGGPAAALAVGLALRLHLVTMWPAVHGGDSVGRLAHSDRLLLAYQLPLPQALVFVVRHVAADPFWTRLAFALVGAAAAAAVAVLTGEIAGRLGGLMAGLFAATHPLLAYYSIVPYQEGPMLLLLALGALRLAQRRIAPAAVLFGLACLCRYEAWIAAALAGASLAWHERARPVAALGKLLAFAAVPVTWMLVWGGLSPPGTYVLDPAPAAVARRAIFLLGKLREYSGLPVLTLSLLGVIVIARRRQLAWAWGLSYVAAMLAVVLAAGHEAPPGSGQVSERLAHVPAVAVCIAAAVALDGLSRISYRRERRVWQKTQRNDERTLLPSSALSATSLPLGGEKTIRVIAPVLVAVAIAFGGARRSAQLVAEANRDPSLRLAWEVAQHAARHLPEDGRLAVIAPPTDPALVRSYLEKVAASGGDVERARDWVAALGSRPPDADRIAAHLPRPPSSVVAGGQPAHLIAVYDDAPRPASPPPGPLRARFTAGNRGVTVYSVP